MAKTHFSLRLHPSTRARLGTRSKEARLPQSVLAERYIEEGLRMDKHPRVVFMETASGERVPGLRSFPRLKIAYVVDTFRQHRKSVKATAEYHRISEEDVRAALAYYADFKDEIDEWLREFYDANERAYQEWRRQQEAAR